MIKVGFTIIGGKTSWMGGINYLKNLMFAISQSNEEKIQPILFVGYKVDKKLLSEFEGLAIIKQASVFDRFSFQWFVDFILRDVFKINPIINTLIRENDIQVFSHSFIYGSDLKCLSVNWIPDFQHLRLPHMFSKLNLLVRDYRLHNMAKYSDRIILSSYDAYNDYKKFAAKYVEKASVIHFVSQTKVFKIKPISYLESKYNFDGEYLFLPNQFWAHKNHKVAFESIKLLKDNDPSVLLLCSGLLMDNRNEKYINSLKDFVEVNGLKKNIRFLGLIPYDDVKLLMHHCTAVINPSYFEGWSSSVEEAKSMCKPMILSNIPVHKEQAAGLAEFFDYDDAELLSQIILKYWNNKINVNCDLIHNDLAKRTKVFGSEYQSLLIDITN
ncbi:glycosyltransferase family 4 protein [Flavobacterium sp. XS2P39]|uniref:glycosyltransferase family 4 protein n=1 Tax=Flavobacterium sp. XS2P39 TaxID=3401725 RepID=UPI003AAEE5DE